MAFRMQFVGTSAGTLDLTALEAGLRSVDPGNAFRRVAGTDSRADLLYAGDIYGQVEINRKGENFFHDAIDELAERIEHRSGKHKKRVDTVLRTATHLVVVQVIWGDRDCEAVLGKIDRIWEWLFENVGGLVVDSEGFYDDQDIILEFS